MNDSIELLVKGVHIGYAKIISTDVLFDDDETTSALQYIRVVSEIEGVVEEDIHVALKLAFGRSCGCGHDCCGHWFGGVRGDIRYNTDGLHEVTCTYCRNV